MTAPYRHPLRLWLSPWCDDCEAHSRGGDEGRLWCQDDVFEPCEQCGRCAESYVLEPIPPGENP